MTIYDHSEADEIAERVDVSLVMTYRDAEMLADRLVRDQGPVVVANVAEALWRRVVAQ